MRKLLVLSTSLAVLISLLIYGGQAARLWADEAEQKASPEATAAPTPDSSNQEAPPLFLAEIKGEVYVIHHGDKAKADPPQQLEKDDRVVTSKNSEAYLLFREGGTFEVGSQSDMRIKDLDLKPKDFKVRFQMAFGMLKVVLHKLTSPSSSFEVEAGGVVTGVRGTTFEVGYNKDKNEEATKTYEGTVYARVNGKEKLVEKGFGMVVSKGGNPILAALGGDDLADFATFLDSSTDLEKKKDIILKQLFKRILEKALKDKTGKGPLGLQLNF